MGKKKLFVFLLPLAVGLSSCLKAEVEEISNLNDKFGEMIITASWDESDSNTKTAIQTDGMSVWWTTSEQINLFYGTGFRGVFTSINEEPSPVANFQGNLTVVTGALESGSGSSEFWAVYPYSPNNSFDGRQVNMTIPVGQVASEGTFSDKLFPAIAKSGNLEMSFYNVCGGACFSVATEGIRAVIFKSLAGESLVGQVQVGFDENGLPRVNNVLSGRDKVIVYAPEGGQFEVGKKYYAVFLPQELSEGLSVSFIKGTEQATATLQRAITIHRSMFGRLDGLDAGLEYGPCDDLPILVSDAAFRRYLLSNYDIDHDGEISLWEAERVTVIANYEGGNGAKSLQGIEYFPNLETLAWERDLLEEIDLSNNTKLKQLYLSWNHLSEIDLSHNMLLTEMCLPGNNLSSLDLTGLTLLWKADIGCQPLSSLNLPVDSSLEELWCQQAQLSELDLSRCPKLWRLYCWQNRLTGLALSGLKELADLRCAQNDFSAGGLDVSANTKLRFLYCFDDKLGSLDVSHNPLLYELGCYDNPIGPELDLSVNLLLDTLKVTGCPNLDRITLETSQVISRGIVKDNQAVLQYSDRESIPISDPGFKAFLLATFDADHNEKISSAEARGIEAIYVCSDEWNVRSLQGIEYMPNLTGLHCWGTGIEDLNLDQPYYYIGRYHWDYQIGPVGTLMEVDLSRNPNLVILNLYNNSGLYTRYRTIDLSHNPKLEFIDLGFTDLDYPDVSALTELRVLHLSHLHGAPPDLSRLSKLRELILDWPQDFRRDFVLHAANHPDLEMVWTSGTGGVDNLYILPKLKQLAVGGQNLTEIDVSRFPPLDELIVSCNPLTSIDLSSQPSLKRFICDGCELQTLDVSCLPNLEYLDCSSQSTLKTVYVAEGQDIPGITSDRNTRRIPAETQVLVK